MVWNGRETVIGLSGEVVGARRTGFAANEVAEKEYKDDEEGEDETDDENSVEDIEEG